MCFLNRLTLLKKIFESQFLEYVRFTSSTNLKQGCEYEFDSAFQLTMLRDTKFHTLICNCLSKLFYYAASLILKETKQCLDPEASMSPTIPESYQ